MKQHNFALVDCNNFYVSCERLFNPSLENRPVVVLSNNDGCAVSRSQEAKDIGVGMGEPYFEIKNLLRSNNGIALSSNYELYADISNRVMDTLKNFSPEMEIYSIDEAFLHLDYYQTSHYQTLAQLIRERIGKDVGIPVSVGVANTKTLSKAANELAKKMLFLNGALSFIGMEKAAVDRYLNTLTVGEVWGIGRKYSQKLKARGVKTALDLAQMNEQVAKKMMAIGGLRTVSELNGRPFHLLEGARRQKTAIVSRSFEKQVVSLNSIKESIATHIFNGTKRLRKQGLKARYLSIFMNSNRHRKNDEQYYASDSFSLPSDSSYPPDFIVLAMKSADKIFKKGINYKKTGVIFSGLSSCNSTQQGLFIDNKKELKRKSSIVLAMDSINNKYGSKMLTIGSMGVDHSAWKMRKELRSDRYTTNINELVKVY